jgi:hypothetical protein
MEVERKEGEATGEKALASDPSGIAPNRFTGAETQSFPRLFDCSGQFALDTIYESI